MESQELNAEQQEAVEHGEGPILVLAGAGTGKTQVITRRVAHLIEQGKVKPEEILALTFTDKAAAEMSERVDELLVNRQLGVLDTSVLTFNAFGDRLLKDYGLDLGLSPAVRLLNRTQQVIFLRDHFDELKLAYFAPWSNPTGHLNSLLEYFSRLSNELVTPADYAKQADTMAKAAAGSNPAAAGEAAKHTELARVYALHQELKRRHEVIDYDDQIRLSIQLLEQRPNVRRQIQQAYRYILVDEFQDTNRAQSRLLELMAGNPPAGGNLMVVGDDDQSIYRFRGATVRNILEFSQRFPATKQVVLRDNYRSTQQILDATYRLIQHNPDRLEHQQGINKRLEAATEGPPPRLLVRADHREEAAAVATEIADAIKAGQNPGDIAVLVRKRSQLDELIPALRRAGVPYRFTENQKLHLQPEVAFVLYGLQHIVNPTDSVSLYHFLEHRLFGLDLTWLSRQASRSRRSHRPLEQVLRQEPTGDKKFDQTLTELSRQVGEWRRFAAEHSASEAAFHFIKDSGYLNYLEELADQDPAISISFENLRLWFESVLEYESVAADRSLGGYLRGLGELGALAEAGAYAEPDLSSEEVAVLTIHQAKGLEFPTVYIFDLNQDMFPGRRRGEAIEMPNLRGPSSQDSASAWLQEERRLMYVAMTRAKRQLVLTFAPHHGLKAAKKPSLFLLEALNMAATEIKLPATQLGLGIRFDHLEALEPIRRLAESKLVREGKLHLTPHQIDDYLTCPFNFRYKYLLEVPEEPSQILMYGNLIHRIINQYYSRGRQGPVKLETLLAMIPMLWKDEGFVTKAEEAKRRRQAATTVRQFYEREEQSGRRPDLIEAPFHVELPDLQLVINGRFDAVYREDEVEIRDFKTGQTEEAQAAAVRAKENVQLAIYALAWQIMTGKLPAKVTLDFVDTGQVASVAKTAKQLEALREKIKSVAAGIRAGRFPRGDCRFCSHRPLDRDQE